MYPYFYTYFFIKTFDVFIFYFLCFFNIFLLYLKYMCVSRLIDKDTIMTDSSQTDRRTYRQIDKQQKEADRQTETNRRRDKQIGI